MKKILFTFMALFAIMLTVSAQTMKVYQNGQLKAIYYVSKEDQVEFSEDFPFPDDNKYNGHEYVDLGLSVKWATMNVGATSPEDYGGYFAWGETQSKSTYNWGSYFDSVDGSNTNFNKYSTSKKTTLDPEDDAAHVNWGGDWRMPTSNEVNELINSCTWTWTTQNGVNGYKVTSKKNGNSIFLPAAGCRNDSSLRYVGSLGGYWSSSLDSSYSYNAYFLDFYSSYVVRGNGNRGFGQSVRAVCP